MKKSNYKGHFCYKSEIGKVRINNEDAVKVLVNGNGNILLLAADGMGGHNKGDYASFETIRILSESFKEKKGFLNSYSALTWLKNIIVIEETFVILVVQKNVDIVNIAMMFVRILLMALVLD